MIQFSRSRAGDGRSPGLPTYALHGLRVASEAPLAMCEDASEGPCDLLLRCDRAPAIDSHAPCPGKVLAEHRGGGQRQCALARDDDGYLLPYFGDWGSCTFRVSADLRSAQVALTPGTDPRWVALFFNSGVLSYLLALRGETTLHATTVERNGRALALLGPSGSGKSTLAALLCSAGAGLVADDLLRLEWAEDGFSCHQSIPEVRLRPQAESLAQIFGESAARRTADDRLALRLPPASVAMPRLRAVVLPQPSRTSRTLSVERLRPARAAVVLSANARAAGWVVERPLRRQLEWAAQVARQVPFYTATVPWGPPFDSEVASELMAAVGLDNSPAPARRASVLKPIGGQGGCG